MIVASLMSESIHVKCDTDEEYRQLWEFLDDEMDILNVNVVGYPNVKRVIVDGDQEDLYYFLFLMTIHLTFMCE